jgi:hypothetical protein
MPQTAIVIKNGVPGLFDYGIVVTWNEEKTRIRAVCFGLELAEKQNLLDCVHSMQHLCFHPLLIPVALSELVEIQHLDVAHESKYTKERFDIKKRKELPVFLSPGT